MRHRVKQGRVMFDTRTYRQLSLAMTCLHFRWLLHCRVRKLREFRQRVGTALTMLRNVRTAQDQKRAPEATCLHYRQSTTLTRSSSSTHTGRRSSDTYCSSSPSSSA